MYPLYLVTFRETKFWHNSVFSRNFQQKLKRLSKKNQISAWDKLVAIGILSNKLNHIADIIQYTIVTSQGSVREYMRWSG